MEAHFVSTIIRLGLAILAGGLIGLERTYNGRPAGFRTHALVCMASSLLMLLTVYQWELLSSAPLETIRVDPTRMAQGIMTGIGFLGAGVIMKEQASVRGLTTAASIWITASIGILIGMGFFTAAFVAVAATFGILTLFRWLENRLPCMKYAKLSLRFREDDMVWEDELLELIKQHSIKATSLGYERIKDGDYFRYQLTLCTRKPGKFRELTDTLAKMPKVNEFRVHPLGS